MKTRTQTTGRRKTATAKIFLAPGKGNITINKRAIERQLEILKDMGCNAIRTAHNPPAPELLDLCDEMGFIVMDEAFDMWKRQKTKFDYHLYWDEWSKRDLEDLIRRSRT